MSRRQWIGVAGVLFGIAMLVGVLISGTTPDSSGSGAVQRYQEHWEDSGTQDKAAIGSMILTYACVLLVAFTASLSRLLRRLDDGPLPSIVLGAGAAAAALLGAGAALINAPALAAVESDYKVDGNEALLSEAIGYYIVTAAIMCAGAMAVAASLSNRRARVLPSWTIVLSGLLAIAALGSIFTAWLGFMILPVWAIVAGVCLLALREQVTAEPGAAPAA